MTRFTSMTATDRWSRRIAGLAICVLALAACSTPEPVAGADFWRGVGVSGGEEVDPPADVDELTARAPLIVRGSVVAVEEVPSDVSGLPEELPVVALAVAVDDVLKGSLDGDELKVVRPREPAVPVDALAEAIPEGDVLFFVEPAGYGGFHATVSDLGLVMESEGEVETVLEPELSAQVLAGVDSLAGLSSAIESSVADG
jgi:hypothetical protein